MMILNYTLSMRTTVNLNEQLLLKVRESALARNISMTALVEEALREKLARLGTGTERPPYRATTFRGDGLQAGVDLDDSAALLDRLENEE